MVKKRANGEGNIRKRADGRWEGRYTAGYHPETGKRIIKNVLGKTQAECKAKLKKAIEESQSLDIGRADEYTVAAWLRTWFELYSKLTLHKRILKDAGLEHIRFHDLRHTFATLALQNGVDVKTVSSMLGHYDAGFTLRTYTHVTRQMQQKAAEKMGSFMAQIR